MKENNSRPAELRQIVGSVVRNFVLNSLLSNGLVLSKFRVFVLQRFGVKIGPRVEIAAACFIGSGSLTIEEGVMLNYQAFLDPTDGIRIGRNTRVGPRVTIITAAHSIEKTEPDRSVRIGENCWLGAQSTILPGVNISNGVVIGAGAVVVSDCDANSLYAGVPARLVKRLPE